MAHGSLKGDMLEVIKENNDSSTNMKQCKEREASE
jgi:hypothetical protein